METSQPLNQTPAKTNRTLLIIAAAIIVLCCFCLIVAVAGYFSFVTVRTIGTQVTPIEEYATSIPENAVTPSLDQDSQLETPVLILDIGDPPEGGLGNDILKQDTWQSVASAAIGQGCDRPISANSTIEVLQQPDSNGVWREKWTVVCRSSDSYAYEVEYILDSTGATFNIRSLP